MLLKMEKYKLNIVMLSFFSNKIDKIVAEQCFNFLAILNKKPIYFPFSPIFCLNSRKIISELRWQLEGFENSCLKMHTCETISCFWIWKCMVMFGYVSIIVNYCNSKSISAHHKGRWYKQSLMINSYLRLYSERIIFHCQMVIY